MASLESLETRDYIYEQEEVIDLVRLHLLG